MRSQELGKNTSKVELQGLSPHGIWILVRGEEFFLDFKRFPWFRKATIEEISQVKLLNPDHLYWPQLDVDLELDSLINPEKYPLVFHA